MRGIPENVTRAIIALGLILCFAGCGGDDATSGHSLRVVAWNVESDGADPHTVARPYVPILSETPPPPRLV